MDVKGEQLRVQKLDDLDAVYEKLRYEKNLHEDSVDPDYKDFLLRILTEGMRDKSSGTRREKGEEHEYSLCDDDDEEEEDDPEVLDLFKSLKVHEKSYIFEYKESDLSEVIKFERDSSSDTSTDEEPRRKLTSVLKEKVEPSSTKSILHHTYVRSTLSPRGDSNLDKGYSQECRRVPRTVIKKNNKDSNQVHGARKVDSQPTSTKLNKKRTRTSVHNKSNNYDEDMIQLDPDLYNFYRYLKPVGDHYVYDNGKDEAVHYDLRKGKRYTVKKDYGCNSDVEIIDSSAFYKTVEHSNSNHKGTTEHSEFRHKVIAALRKRFDTEEYEKLWQHIKFHKPKERHIDLRDGREKDIATEKVGKSYLDHYPELTKMLRKAKDDKPKCLNLLRGFFLWIEQPEAFYPWQDQECLAVYPGSV